MALTAGGLVFVHMFFVGKGDNRLGVFFVGRIVHDDLVLYLGAGVQGGCADAEERLEKLQQEYEQQREILCSAVRHRLLAAAAREASLIRLRAEHALSLRLHERARFCLRQLRGKGDRLFRSLAAELPDLPWHTVRSAPSDIVLAADCFPGAMIIPEESLAGGLTAETEDNSLTIDNTLETRLERLWPDLLPHLIAELRARPE